jgi:hypothetical protein
MFSAWHERNPWEDFSYFLLSNDPSDPRKKTHAVRIVGQIKCPMCILSGKPTNLAQLQARIYGTTDAGVNWIAVKSQSTESV